VSEETKRNPDETIFSEPIQADIPIRQIDRKFMEGYDDIKNSIRNISGRVTRVEAVFDGIKKDVARVEEMQKEMAANLESTASGMSAISNRFGIHAEMEEYQWTSVNKAHEVLTQIGVTLNEHLKQSEAVIIRVNWIERLIWAMWGVVGACAAALIPLALKGIGV